MFPHQNSEWFSQYQKYVEVNAEQTKCKVMSRDQNAGQNQVI